MKYLTLTLILAAALMSGCGKKDASTEVAGTVAPPTTEPAAEPAAEPAVDKVAATMEQARSAAMSLASQVDFANLSWNDISKVPYGNKDQLVKWASPQIEALGDQLKKAAMEKGLTALAGMKDDGWQGALKKTVEALDYVRTSNPETWEMATGALATAWEALQAEATKYISQK